jgi:GTP pyrophosphokinase
VPEEKSDFLLRVMQAGSSRARTLKLADRISNLTALGYVHEAPFIRRYVAETRAYILPYAEAVNPDMFRELSDLLDSREQLLTLIAGEPVVES